MVVKIPVVEIVIVRSKKSTLLDGVLVSQVNLLCVGPKLSRIGVLLLVFLFDVSSFDGPKTSSLCSSKSSSSISPPNSNLYSSMRACKALYSSKSHSVFC